MTSGIYQITNTITGKRYIGSAVDIVGRWCNHRSELRRGTHHSKHLQSSWKKHGEDAFLFEILEECGIMMLINREQHYLDTILKAQEFITGTSKTFLTLGYNMNPSAANRLGTKQSAASIQKSRLNHPFRVPVHQYNASGVFVAKFDSFKTAAEANGIVQGCVAKSVHKMQPTKSSHYFLAEETIGEHAAFLDSLKTTPAPFSPYNKGLRRTREVKREMKMERVPVLMFDFYGCFLEEFPSIMEVAERFNTNSASVVRKLNATGFHKFNGVNGEIGKYLFVRKGVWSEVLSQQKALYAPLLAALTNQETGGITIANAYGEKLGCFRDTAQIAAIDPFFREGALRGCLRGIRAQYKGFQVVCSGDIV